MNDREWTLLYKEQTKLPCKVKGAPRDSDKAKATGSVPALKAPQNTGPNWGTQMGFPNSLQITVRKYQVVSESSTSP